MNRSVGVGCRTLSQPNIQAVGILSNLEWAHLLAVVHSMANGIALIITLMIAVIGSSYYSCDFWC